MHGSLGELHPASRAIGGCSVTVVTREQLGQVPRWADAFAAERKDHRFYEILEDTIRGEFDYKYLLVYHGGAVAAIQPIFLLDQDLLAGIEGRGKSLAEFVRRYWPRFMRARTLMIGCAAGEGHLDGSRAATAQALADALPKIARDLKVALIVLKEFPARDRTVLQCFRDRGFARVPSMPMTRLSIDYADFDDYVGKALSPRTRGKLRRKLRKAERADPPIELSIVQDATPHVDDIYPLYLGVYERSSLKFEKLTKEFFAAIGQRMPDKARFFLWRAGGRLIAFGLCLVDGDLICHEYVGFDYTVAFDVNLYYRVFHDIVEWAIAHGYKRYLSGSLNYDPKWHLRHSLEPVDLYVRHTSPVINAVLRRMLPLLEPTRYDKTLPKFGNYRELWGEDEGRGVPAFDAVDSPTPVSSADTRP